MTLLFLQNIGLPGMIVIGVIVLLLFGNRLPNVMRNLGRGVTNFKQGLKEGATDDDGDDEKPAKAKKD